MYKRIVIFLFNMLLCVVAKSQQTPLYSQYMMNGFIINSAMAGYDGYTTINSTSRQQWVGFQDAPRTFSISAQTRILKRSYIIKPRPLKGNIFIRARKGNVGLGVEVYNDKNGNFYNTGIRLAYAYHISFPNSQLSFGLAGSISQLKLNTNDLKFRVEESTAQLAQPCYIPDANVGVFYENRSMTLGLSAAQLFQFRPLGNAALSKYRLNRHYYFIGSYRYGVGAYYTFEPSILLKTSEQLAPQLDLSYKAFYKDLYWGGISYRTTSTIIFMTGMKVKRVHIGLSYDYALGSAIQQYNYGSVELMLSLKFGDSAKRYRWVNRY